MLPPSVKQAPPAKEFQLHGRFVFTPGTTQEQFREFLWAGLHFLEKEAAARGLSDDEKSKLLTTAFDCFHGAADDMWGKLKKLVTSADALCPTLGEELFVAQPESLEALQDDKPSPVEFHRVREFEILNPDADLLDSDGM